jgi:hypothetical protein
LRPFSLGFGGEYIHEPYVVIFLLIPGAHFWGFRCPRVSGVLGGNPSVPLDSTSFGGP